MEPLFAIAGLALGFGAMQLGYFAGLQRGRSERAAQPPVIRFVPSTVMVPTAPWQSSVGPDRVSRFIWLLTFRQQTKHLLRKYRVQLAPYRHSTGGDGA
jgi:hypothetical protein